MTAVASHSSFQPLPRWSNVDGQGGLNSMSADEVSRMFQPRKAPQRKDSSSSMASNSSTSSSSATFSAPPAPPQSNGDAPAINGDQGGWGPRKKAARGLWPPSKAEPVSGISTARSQPLPTPSSGQSAASTMSAMHQPSPILPSQNRMQSQQPQNGARVAASSNQSESHPILVLLPLTGTFERKHITVPYQPEVLRIGRQTNVKTVPTPVNGYFDSKVLSRQHAEVWASPEGKILIRDVKSSNGTFVNGYRLSPENRDSEPHPLGEGDTLELGIDIVSEDQKSIVHHKVSARVEFAGVYGSGNNASDLNFGDMDSGSGNGINPANGQQMARGRGSSQGSTGNGGRVSGPGVNGNSANAMGPQRQMNLWLNPITIEQVVKKLTMELKQAKQQSQDLNRTGDFFTTLLILEPGQELPKPPPEHKIKAGTQPNGISPSVNVKPASPFSQPPAPPPQQPLPEKPDFAISDPPLPRSDLKRTDTERPKSALNSPTRQEQPQSSQILSLVEALSTAKREIDSQGDRVKQLEVLLTRERKARESAEERAKRLLEGHFPDKANGYVDSTVDEEAFERVLDIPEALDRGLTNGYHTTSDSSDDSLSDAASITTILPSPSSNIKSPEELQGETKAVDASTSRLKERLDLLVREMDEMKITMENYKRRAEGAEEERNSLREMVQKIRATSSNGSVTSSPITDSSYENSTPATSATESSSSSSPFMNHDSSHTLSSLAPRTANGSAISNAIPDFKELERTVTSVLQQSRHQQGHGNRTMAMQSAPYASMVGVVLIGVGLMTWLNGWQRGER